MINWFSTNSTKAIQWRTNNLFNKWCWKYWMATCNIIKLDCYSHHVPYTNINSMWIIGRYVWATYKITCANIIQRWYTTQFKNGQKNRRRIRQRRYLDNKHLRKCSTSFVIREIQMKTTCSLEGLEFKNWPNQVLARMGSVVALGWRDHKSAWGNVGELWVCHMNTTEFNFSLADRHLGCCQFGLVAGAKMYHPDPTSWKDFLSSSRQCGQKKPAVVSFFGVHLSCLAPSQSSLHPVTKQRYRGWTISSSHMGQFRHTIFAPEFPAKLG